LEIDEISPLVADDDVLRLKIAMDEHARVALQLLGNLLQSREASQFTQLPRIDAEMTAKAILEEIMLFPNVKRRVELRWQIGPDFRRVSRGDAVQLRDFFER
jgi:hypothetical protein